MMRRRLGSGLLAGGRFIATNVLAMICGMMVWAVVPLIFGWSAHTVVSGSMAPRVKVGDILVSAPMEPSEFKPGMVAVFNDPTDPGRVISHRIMSIENDRLVTKGDANATVDTAEVPLSEVIGVAKLNVPLIGYPAVWAGQQRHGLLVVTLAGLIGTALLALTPRRRPGETSHATAAPARTGSIPSRSTRKRRSPAQSATIPDQRASAEGTTDVPTPA